MLSRQFTCNVKSYFLWKYKKKKKNSNKMSFEVIISILRVNMFVSFFISLVHLNKNDHHIYLKYWHLTLEDFSCCWQLCSNSNISRQHFKIFSYCFPKTADLNCFLSRKFTWNVSCCFGMGGEGIRKMSLSFVICWFHLQLVICLLLAC